MNMMTQPFLNICYKTAKGKKSTHCSVHSHCLFLILEWSIKSLVQNEQFQSLQELRTPENIPGQQDVF